MAKSQNPMVIIIFYQYIHWIISLKLKLVCCSVKETHQIAEAQQEKNAKLREAFGISEYFVEGSSLDAGRRAKEEAARQAAQPRYQLVRTPSPAPAPDTTAPRRKRRKAKDRLVPTLPSQWISISIVMPIVNLFVWFIIAMIKYVFDFP